MPSPKLLILPLSLLLFGFVDPYHFKDAETGFAVDPPNNYIVMPLPPKEGSVAKALVAILRYDADVRSPTPPFCVAGLYAREDNVERTQTELNARMRDTGRVTNMIATFNGAYTVIADEPIELGEVAGHQFIMEERGAAGAYEDLLQVNSSFDTPDGRIVLNCATERTNLTANLVSFGLIRESITLP